jgi:hypothetical protein
MDSMGVLERIEGPEEELENAGLALFLQERLAGSNVDRLSAGDFLAQIGCECVEQTPGG